MIRHNFPLSLAISLGVGLLCGYVIIVPGTYINAFNPMHDWLLAKGVRGYTYFALFNLIDLFVCFLLAIPFAYALTRLRPERLPIYVLVAVLPWIAWDATNVLTNPIPGLSLQIWLVSSLHLWLPLVVSALLLRFVMQRRA